MTNTFDTVAITDGSADQPQPTAVTTIQHRTLRERGMVTIEYAVGIVLVIAMVGVMIAAIKTGVFGGFVDQIIGALAKVVLQVIAGQ